MQCGPRRILFTHQRLLLHEVLLDMGLAQSTARFLRDQGYDAVHLREQGLQRLPDEEIIDKAREEARIILTHDLDFGRLMALSGERLPSVITFRLKKMRAANVNRFLRVVLERHESQLAQGVLISVNEETIRVRLLPV